MARIIAIDVEGGVFLVSMPHNPTLTFQIVNNMQHGIRIFKR
ncbi:hypothetical protein CHELA40_12016 [Chelatococcus asaccharovorans]|nr:hypothetical protein CHELA40_12016 [Chelatococcus asaccharovorans]